MANKEKPFSDNFDVTNPRITFHAPDKTFDRLLKERSLSDLKEIVRKKLGLGSGSVVQFTQIRMGKRVDLEDEDDFHAFCAVANEQRHVNIQVALTENSVVEGSSVYAKGSMSPLPVKLASALPSNGRNMVTYTAKLRQLEEKERLKKKDKARESPEDEKKQKKKERLRLKKEEKRRREQEEQNRQNIPATDSSTSTEASSPSTRSSPLPSINRTSQHPLPSTQSSYQLPSKSVWSKEPPQTTSVPSRSQFPALSTQPQPSHSSTLGQGVSVQDGVSVPQKQGTAVTFGSIDNVSAPLSTSPATPPPVKSEGVKPFGTVSNTHINGKASPAADPSTSTPSTPKSSASGSTLSIRATPFSVTPKSKFDVNKLFQKPSSQPSNSSTSTETSPATPNASPLQVPPAISSPRLGAHPSLPMTAPMQPPVPWPGYYYGPEHQHQHYMQTCPGWNWTPPQMSPATKHPRQQTPPPSVAAPSRLASIRPLEDLSAVTYPEGARRPKPELNIGAKGGKFRYDRGFLMQFMFICKEKPAFLFSLDAFGLEPMPSQSTCNKKSKVRKTAAAGSEAPSLGPLPATENRWDRPLEVVDTANALLDQLPIGGFDSISDQMVQWVNRSENQKDGRTLIHVIRLVFEKVTDDDAWSEMYARLCMKMMEQINLKVQDEGIKNSEGNPITGGQLFRKYLLNRCQEHLEHSRSKEVTTAAEAAEDRAVKAADESSESGEIALYADEYYAAQKAKRRGLGLIKFIGELFKRQMLTKRIMHGCIQTLLNNAENPLEEDIVCLCTLLTMIGSLLDTRKARTHIDIYFQRMQEIGKNISPRTQSMLQDIIELRKRNWQVRKAVVAPITIVWVDETL